MIDEPGPVKLREALLVTCACLGFSLQACLSSLGKSPTADVEYHYRFGQTLLGRPDVGLDAMPLDSTLPIVAVPVLGSRLRERLDPVLGPSTGRYTFEHFTMPSLLWARLPVMVMGVLLLLVIWGITRRWFGPFTASVALFIGACEPTLIGHARFATTDVPGALAFFGGSAALIYYLDRPRIWRLVLLAVVLGLAQVVKLYCLLLYPVSVAAIFVRHVWIVGQAGGVIWRWLLRGAAQSMFASVLFIAALLGTLHSAYAGVAPEVTAALSGGALDAFFSTHAGPLWRFRFIVPIEYIHAVAFGRAHNSIGHAGYLLGAFSGSGWPHYFPLAMALKMQLPVLLLATTAVFWRRTWRWPVLVLCGIAGGFLAYLCFVLRVNIGVRHALPVFPVIIVLAAVGAGRLRKWIAPITTRWRRRLAAAILPAWIVFHCVNICPHYAEFFNELAGGSNQGWRFLIDSNLDWGQDDGLMRRWAAAQPRPVTINPTTPVSGLIVISANKLIGITPQESARTAWLRDAHKPVARLSPAVFVFDVPD